MNHCLIMLACLGPLADVVPAAHPVVPGFERFFTGKDAVKGGQLLLGELNCISCHQSSEASAARKQAPVLDEVGSRVRVSYLRQSLRDPQAVKPGTTMPALFVGDPKRDEKIEALVHLLASTGAPLQGRPADRKTLAAGRDLYQRVGCVACHGSRDVAGRPETVLSTSVPLGELAAKYTLAGLTAFLENPLHSRPSGRMPRLLADKEARAVAAYLLQQGHPSAPVGTGTVRYAYFEGSWEQLPDFEKLKPNAAGTGIGFDLGVARRGSNYALRFDGFFRSEREGNYQFTLASDDGSRLWVDGELVVDNDGIHPMKAEQGRVRLAPGTHRVVVGFLQGGGGAELEVDVQGPGWPKDDLAARVAATEDGLLVRTTLQKGGGDDVEMKPALVEKGKALFAAAGCASCHALKIGAQSVSSTANAPPLDRLRGSGGCLAGTPAAGLPRYALSPAQREALIAALKSPAAVSKSPGELIARTLVKFNCYACHNRDGLGGPEEPFNSFFATTQPEMGDEARVPPPLDGVGAKLNADYLQKILDRGTHDRPYMRTQMPGFGAANVGHLVAALAALDKVPVTPPVAFEESLPKVKATGRHLVGAQGFGCIKCHTFAGHKAEGVQGMDMLLLPQRLQRDWFQAYVADPQRFRPGTRMPAAFFQGQSMLPNILGGKAATQLEAVWLYLRDGAKAQLPVGLLKKSMPLVPTTGAIVYRNFIQGAGTRAIAVGYPEKASLAFDANELRLALLWQGAFLDVARHWDGRGEGFEGPLGDNVLHLPAGVPFAVLDSPEQAWPAAPAKAQGYGFLGYRLTADDRPTFLYSVRGVRVEDFPSPVPGQEVALRRRLKFTSAAEPANLFFRAAAGDKIEPLADGWFRVDGAWKVKVEGGGTPRVRQSESKIELLVPVKFADNKTELVEQIVW